jgi:PHD/YefM family antitoxin component YafN of YafNO toxin-antitoxin module
MTAIQKKIVVDEHGKPQEVIISWAQFCELSEALGLDLDATEQAELSEALDDSRAGRREAFTPLEEL